jgi:hypothetical protein
MKVLRSGEALSLIGRIPFGFCKFSNPSCYCTMRRVGSLPLQHSSGTRVIVFAQGMQFFHKNRYFCLAKMRNMAEDSFDSDMVM